MLGIDVGGLVTAQVHCATCGEVIVFERLPMIGTVQERCRCGVRPIRPRPARDALRCGEPKGEPLYRTERRKYLQCGLPFETLTRRKALLCSDSCREVRKNQQRRPPALRPILVGKGRARRPQ